MLNILLCILVSLVILVIALRFKKAALILLGILIVAGSVFGIIVWQSGKPKEPKTVWKSRSSHTLSARKLMAHYGRNAYGANETYGNKVISLTGNLSAIHKVELAKYPNQFRHVIWLRASSLAPSSSKHGGGKANEYTELFDSIPNSSSKHGGGKAMNYDDILDDILKTPPQSSSKHGGGMNYEEFIPPAESGSKHGGGKVDRVKCNFNRSEAYSLRNLKVGDSVEIKGRVSGHAGGLGRDNYSDTREPFLYVTLEECILVKSGK